MAVFQELPPEVLLQIFTFLDPLDVVYKVRRVCRAFHATSQVRSLWRELLYQVCRENSVSPRTYDRESMSLLDLEHATTMPRRFMQTHLRKPSPDDERLVRPYSRQYIDFLTSDIYSGRGFENDIIRLYLVPGGRYLLTHHSHSIHMWDLGVPGDPRGIPQKLPIGSIDLHEQGHNGAPGLTPHPTRDSDGLLLFTCLDDMSDLNTCMRDVRVYCIYPSSADCQFRLLDHYPLILPGESYGLYKLSYEKMVIVLETQMRVWDFTTNTSAAWGIDIIGQYESIFMKDGYVILCDERGLLMWEIPQLHPCDSARSNEIQGIPPIFTISLREDIPRNLKFNYEGLADWYYSCGQPFYFDFVVCPERTVHLTRYLLDFVDLEEGDSRRRGDRTTVPGTLRKLMSFTVPEDDGILEEFRVADGNIVMYWSAPNGLNIQSIPMDTEKSSRPAPIVVVYEMAMVDRYLSTLCSSSGRVCHMMTGDVIEIADFVPYPDRDRRTLTP